MTKWSSVGLVVSKVELGDALAAGTSGRAVSTTDVVTMAGDDSTNRPTAAGGFGVGLGAGGLGREIIQGQAAATAVGRQGNVRQVGDLRGRQMDRFLGHHGGIGAGEFAVAVGVADDHRVGPTGGVEAPTAPSVLLSIPTTTRAIKAASKAV